MALLTGSPVVGGMTTNQAKVIIRTDAAASSVVIEYDTDRNFSNPVATNGVPTVAASDFTATIVLANLTADTRYYYRVKVDNVIQDPGVVLRFDTFPASGNFTFAVFADVAPVDRDATAYVSAGSEDPLFAVQLGDLDHRDPTTLSEMRQMHKDMRDRSKLHGADFVNRILSKRALVHVWDDHDYGGNDEDKNFPGREDAWQAFDEYYPTYARPNPSNGLWHKFTCADAEFFVLDLRSQRDDNTDPDNDLKSILDGDSIPLDQKNWLLDGLKGSTAKWKFILSSVTFNNDARPLSTDLWHSFTNEAKDIGKWLSKQHISDVIVLSGDIHTGGGIDDGTNSLIDIPEMTVAHTNLADGNRNNLGTWSEGITAGAPNGAGYSMVTVTANSVTLTTKAANGTIRHSYTIT